MRRLPPKHLARHGPNTPTPAPRFRPGLLVAVVAVALALVGLRSTTDATTSTITPPSPTTTIRPPRPTASGLLPEAGFEVGTDGWRPLGGARLGRVPSGRTGAWAARLDAGAGSEPGMTVPDVARCRAGATYAAELWVKGARSGQPVEVRLLEVVGRTRFAVDTVGVVLTDTRWHRVEVTHLAYRPGARLAIELIAPGHGHILVDDVRIQPRPLRA